jgi:hypothetical protein
VKWQRSQAHKHNPFLSASCPIRRQDVCWGGGVGGRNRQSLLQWTQAWLKCSQTPLILSTCPLTTSLCRIKRKHSALRQEDGYKLLFPLLGLGTESSVPKSPSPSPPTSLWVAVGSRCLRVTWQRQGHTSSGSQAPITALPPKSGSPFSAVCLDIVAYRTTLKMDGKWKMIPQVSCWGFQQREEEQGVKGERGCEM